MFICTLEPGSPIPIVVLKGNNEFIVRAPVGFEDSTGVVYSALVAFSPLIGYADIPGYECVFSIIEAQPDESHIRDCWDGLETKPLIPDTEHRNLIRGTIGLAVTHLIDEACPGLVSMTTHSANLPPKALRKFNELCRVFRGKGYIAGRADSWNGRYTWMMEKPSLER
jgi:hypothetical protein